MKRLTIYIITLFCLSISTSCKKFLDERPVSASTDVTFWKNEKDANSALAGGYALLRKSLNQAGGLSFFAYGDLPADEYTTTIFAYTDVVNMRWDVPVPSVDTWHPIMQLRRYDTFYSTIDQTNRCIKFIPTIADDKFTSITTKNHLLGEAYFLRAFNYFYMSRIWGDIPLVTESVPITEAVDLPRSSAAEVLAQALKDANMAVELLGWNNTIPSDRAVRANKGSALALLAHIYAWMGDYQNCNLTADKIIDSKYYTEVNKDNYLDIFKGKSTEGIFEIAQSNENEGTINGIANFTLIAPYLTTRVNNAQFTIGKTNLDSVLFRDKNDKRFTKAFALTNTENPICIKYANITYNNSGQNVIRAVEHNNIIVFRLSDIILLKAEALASLAQYSQSRVQLNKIRSSAGLGEWTGQDNVLFEEVIAERGRELFLEGHRYYDLVRLARSSNAESRVKFPSMGRAEFNAGKYYWPLDPALFVINKKLTQTPFWNSKL